MPPEPVKREAAVQVARRLREAGFQALFAGGCVRDLLLGREPKDFDVASDAKPADVRRLFRRTVEVGAAFGVMRVLIGAEQIEVAAFRTDFAYEDGRHPTGVTFTDAKADAQRRDFTINGMFLDPLTDEVIDYVGGREDLKAGVIRAIGGADDRLSEDRLRMLRAVRFATVLGFAVEAGTAAAIRRHAGEIVSISAERVREELLKTLGHPRRAQGVRLLWDYGLIAHVLPQTWNDYAQSADMPPGLAAGVAALPPTAAWDTALAYLVKGVPPTAEWTVEAMTLRLRAAEARSATIEELSDKLALTRPERAKVQFLIRRQWELDDGGGRDLAWKKRLFARAHFSDLVDFHAGLAAEFPSGGPDAAEAIALYRSLTPEQIAPPPLVTGHDVLAAGVSAGPRVKELLDRAYDAQLNGELTAREQALARVREWASR